jgi:hypothetical protein
LTDLASGKASWFLRDQPKGGPADSNGIEFWNGVKKYCHWRFNEKRWLTRGQEENEKN